jgi:hypothetical protein
VDPTTNRDSSTALTGFKVGEKVYAEREAEKCYYK